MIIDKLDTRAKKEADKKEKNTTNNFRNQEKNELHVNGNSINVIKFIRPVGNNTLSDQNGHFLKDPDRLEHEQQITKGERGTQGSLCS